jgi:hypothetical protein
MWRTPTVRIDSLLRFKGLSNVIRPPKNGLIDRFVVSTYPLPRTSFRDVGNKIKIFSQRLSDLHT